MEIARIKFLLTNDGILAMEKKSIAAMYEFPQGVDVDAFEKELKFAIKNLGIENVTINKFIDGRIGIVHEWAKTDDDLRFSHIVSEKLVEKFGGKYTTELEG